jgi:hypothetical protein
MSSTSGSYSKPPGDFSEGLAGLILDKDARGDYRGYIDRNGNVVLELPNAVVVGRFSEGLAAVGLKGKVGFVDHAGKFVVDPAFQSGWIPFSGVPGPCGQILRRPGSRADEDLVRTLRAVPLCLFFGSAAMGLHR